MFTCFDAYSVSYVVRKESENCEKNTFSEGEMVLISGAEPEYIAMATGIIKDISKHFITIDTDR